MLDVDPAVPHHLMRKEAVFRNPHRIYFATTTIVFRAARVCIRVREDDVDTARADSSASTWTLTPVVVPACDVFDCVGVLVPVVSARILVPILWPDAIFMKRW